MIIPNTVEHVEIEHATLNNNPHGQFEGSRESGTSKSGQGQQVTPQLLKSMISFRALMESDGRQLKRVGQQWGCRCPFHPDSTPSFFIDEEDDRARCYGCGWYGDIFKYAMDRTGCNFGAVFHHLANSPTLRGTKTKSVPRESRDTKDEFRFTLDQVREIDTSTSRILNDHGCCVRIAESRKWKPETIRSLAASKHLGWGGDALNFIYKTGIKVRQWPGKEFYWWAGGPHIWRAEVMKNASKIFITEGEPDAITLIDLRLERQLDTAVVAAPSASTFHNAWAELFIGKDVVLCFDADEAGRQGAARVGALLQTVANSVKEWNPKEVA